MWFVKHHSFDETDNFLPYYCIMKKIMSGKWNPKLFLMCQLESCCISPFLFYFSLLDTSIHKQKPVSKVCFAKIWHIFQQSWAKLSSYNLSQRFFMRRRTFLLFGNIVDFSLSLRFRVLLFRIVVCVLQFVHRWKKPNLKYSAFV